MECRKCSGLMIQQSFHDQFLNFEGWKCLNCGKITLKKEKVLEYDYFGMYLQQQRTKKR